MTVKFYLAPGVRNRKYYLAPGMRNGKIYLAPNDSFGKIYLAVKGLTGRTSFPAKFCQIRWMHIFRFIEKGLKLFDDMCKFVKQTKLPKITSVEVICATSRDPLFKCKLATFVSIAQALEGFLMV